MSYSAIFLDRDGVLNEEVGYVTHKDQLKIIEGVKEALKIAKAHGFKLIVITNQSAMGKGLMTIEDQEEIFDKLCTETGNVIDAIYWCPHLSTDNCDCRKPKTKLFEYAQRDFDIDLNTSYMVGDKETDLEAGRRAGLSTIGVLTGYGDVQTADYICDDVLGAVKYVCSNSMRR